MYLDNLIRDLVIAAVLIFVFGAGIGYLISRVF